MAVFLARSETPDAEGLVQGELHRPRSTAVAGVLDGETNVLRVGEMNAEAAEVTEA